MQRVKQRIAAKKAAEMNAGEKTTLAKSNVVDPRIGAATAAQAQGQQPPIRFRHLFRYTTPLDRLILLGSIVCGAIAGAALPLMTIVLGNTVTVIRDFQLGQSTAQEFRHTFAHNALWFVYIGVGEFGTVWLSTYGFVTVGERNARAIRARYLEAVLRQDISFFDHLGTGEVSNRLATDINAIQSATSEKLAIILTSLGTFLSAWIVSMALSWRLGLIALGSIVALSLLLITMMRFIKRSEQGARGAFIQATSLAGEAIRAIETITAYSAQDKVMAKFDVHLSEAERWGKRMRILVGSSIGGVTLVIYLNVALMFWEGSRLLVRADITEKHVITVTLAMIMGTYALVYVARNAGQLAGGLAAGAKIFAVIARPSPIDSLGEGGATMQEGTVEGQIEFDHVSHSYPSAPGQFAISDLCIRINAGETVALVGASGSGKSTCINLLQRFYDAGSGTILLDGQDIKSLNVAWLRQQMSLVRQESHLFSGTVFENIANGLIGSKHQNASEHEQMELVTRAARMANAHDFIIALPEGYQTTIGEDGNQLSGGQRQRLAIARAVVKDPNILLLDEATSALDTTSELLVQEAINKALRGRTTLVIAHRLSTVKNADRIVVMNRGQVVEEGTHQELLSRNGLYQTFFQGQQLREGEANTEEVLAEKADTPPSSVVTGGTTELASETELAPNADIPEQTVKQAAKPVRRPMSKWRMVVGLQGGKPWYLALGVMFCIIAGGGTPTHVIFFVKSLVSLSLPPDMYGRLRSDINFWSGMYFMLAFVIWLSYCAQGTALGISSSRLLHWARYKTLQTVLQQNLAFFSRPEGSTGALVSMLGVQTTNMASISSVILGSILSVATTLIAAIALSITFAWRLGLVVTALFPLIFLGGFLGFYLMRLIETRIRTIQEDATAYASEAVSGVHTVAALTMEKTVCQEYRRRQDRHARSARGTTFVIVTTYACAQSIFFFVAALGFWWGGILVAEHDYGLFEFFVSFLEILFGTQSASAVFSQIADLSKSWAAAGTLSRLFSLGQDAPTPSPQRLAGPAVQGGFELRGVSFSYPTATRGHALKVVDISVWPGQHVALVGPSGGGKSTILALLERFYAPQEGEIVVDGTDLSNWDMARYRASISLVTQNPVLISGTIRDNILLGATDEADEENVIEACRLANIHDFVQSLPEGLSTRVGSKGGLLSGGQRQRIAIARALIRNPRVLLLDEATSALDSESEAAVLEALKAASKGRTTVTVAHRLRTVQEADKIYVLDKGSVVEQGKHDELVQAGGLYAELVKAQNL